MATYKVQVDYYFNKTDADNDDVWSVYTTTGSSSMVNVTFKTAAQLGMTKTGYQLTMWIETGTGAGYEPGSAYLFPSDKIVLVYGYWEKLVYTVAYNANGGSGAPASQTKTYGVSLKLSTTKPTRVGYTFKGWATSKTGSVAYAAGATYTANAAVTLYAVWQANPTVTIKYNTNGGASSVPANQSGLGGTSLTLSSSKPSYGPHTGANATITYNKAADDATIEKTSDTITLTTHGEFLRWNTKPDGTGTNYTPGQTITLPINTSATTINLYAQWNTKDWVYMDMSLLPTVRREQFVLTGWSQSLTRVALIDDFTQITGNTTLYAIWTARTGGMLQIPGTGAITSSNVGDEVRIVGLGDTSNDGIYHIASVEVIDDNTYIFFDEDFKSDGQQDASELDLYIYGSGNHIPNMDYICSQNNRLWGCSSRMRTIYASALGDPTDFLTFNGMSTDAYYTPVGTAGDFTGCCELNNNVLFMKQHCIHKVLGSFPAEYALYTYDYDGVSESNALSLVNCDGTAVFVSEHGIGTYAGATTGILSKALGEGGMHNAMAGYNGEKYSLYYQDDAGNDHSYEYDMRYGIWIEKNYGKVLSYAHLVDDDFVLVEDPDRNAVYKVNTDMELDGDWEILYRDFYEMVTGSYKSQSMIFEKKRYTSLTFRLELPEGSWIKAYVKADDGEWHPMMKLAGNAMRVASYRIMTPRCDRLKLRLSGHGPMRLLGLERDFTIGSRR